MSDLRLPKSVTEIDPAWLGEALRRGGALPSGRVTSCGVTVIGEGEGFVGELGRIKAEYEPAGAGPASVIAKVPTQLQEARTFFLMAGLYAIEGSFYRDLASRVPIRTPRPYFNAMDAAAGEFVLLLEDLAPARAGNQVEACARADAEVAVDNMAALHAAYWDKPELDRLAWLPKMDEETRGPALGAMLPFVWPMVAERAGDLLGAKIRAIAPVLGARFAPLGALMSAAPRTLVHGDYRLDNMFFGLADGGEFALLDWQAAQRGRGPADLVYFLVGSLPPDDRRDWEDDLTERYLRGLRDRGVSGYGLDECRRDMKAAALYQFGVMVLLVSGAGDIDLPERGPVLARQALQRYNAYVEDNDFADTPGVMTAAIGPLVAVDLGGTRLRVAVADSTGALLRRADEPVDAASGPSAIADRIAALAGRLLDGAEASAAGIASPGLVDPDRGVVIGARNLKGWQHVPLATMLAQRLGCAVHVENDVNMAATGEAWRGAGRGAADVAFIGIGTGVGVGLVLGGRLHRGHHFSAGEVNPLPSGIAGPDGRLLGIEAVAGGPAILRRALEAGLTARGLTTDRVFALAAAGDALAGGVVADAASALGLAVAWIAVLADPQVIILGGGVAAQGEALRAAVEAQAASSAGGRLPPVVLAVLGADAQLFGALREAMLLAGLDPDQP